MAFRGCRVVGVVYISVLDVVMITKIIIGIIMGAILFFLARAGYYLVRDGGATAQTANSLTWRIALSMMLFVLLFIAFCFGLIQPHSLR